MAITMATKAFNCFRLSTTRNIRNSPLKFAHCSIIHAFQVNASARLMSTQIVQHRDEPGNSRSDTFDFTPENYAKVQKLISQFPPNYSQSAVRGMLTLAQEQNENWLTLAAMNKVAEILNLPPIRVYEVATFYSMYNREKVGKFHLQVCGTTPCMLCGSERLVEAIEQYAGIKKGETSADGLFTLTEVECLGACANAPMMQVNNHEYYENLTPEILINILEMFKSGNHVEKGPQNGQRSCEGPRGQATLKSELTDVFSKFRDFDEVKRLEKEKLEKAKAEAAAKAKAAEAGAAPKNS